MTTNVNIGQFDIMMIFRNLYEVIDYCIFGSYTTLLINHMKIDLSRLHICMSHLSGYSIDIYALCNKQSRICMPETVEGNFLLYTGRFYPLFNCIVDYSWSEAFEY